MIFRGNAAARVAALDFAYRGKTRAELEELVDRAAVMATRRQVYQELERLNIVEDRAGRLRLPGKFIPTGVTILKRQGARPNGHPLLR